MGLVALGLGGELEEHLLEPGAVGVAELDEGDAGLVSDAGVASSPIGEDGLLAATGTAQVGTIALAAGVPVIELRPGGGASLEEMFLQLTAETQRDDTTDDQRANDHRPEGAVT